jgi:flagellar protein FliS
MSVVTYQNTAVLTATREQLIVHLYDGAIRNLHRASDAIRARNIQMMHDRLRAAERIIMHLQASLNMDAGGEIAQRLSGLYSFYRQHLNRARLDLDPHKMQQVATMLSTLREGWREIADNAAASPIATA